MTVANADTSAVTWQGQTDGNGNYRALALRVGRYDVAVGLSGFKPSPSAESGWRSTSTCVSTPRSRPAS